MSEKQRQVEHLRKRRMAEQALKLKVEQDYASEQAKKLERAQNRRAEIAAQIAQVEADLDDAVILENQDEVIQLQAEITALNALLSSSDRLLAKAEGAATEEAKANLKAKNDRLLSIAIERRQAITVDIAELEKAAYALCAAAKRVTEAASEGHRALAEIFVQLPQPNRQHFKLLLNKFQETDGAIASAIEDIFRREGLFGGLALPAPWIRWVRHDFPKPTEFMNKRNEKLIAEAQHLHAFVQELIK